MSENRNGIGSGVAADGGQTVTTAVDEVEGDRVKIARAGAREDEIFHDVPTCVNFPESGRWIPRETVKIWGFRRCKFCEQEGDR